MDVFIPVAVLASSYLVLNQLSGMMKDPSPQVEPVKPDIKKPKILGRPRAPLPRFPVVPLTTSSSHEPRVPLAEEPLPVSAVVPLDDTSPVEPHVPGEMPPHPSHQSRPESPPLLRESASQPTRPEAPAVSIKATERMEWKTEARQSLLLDAGTETVLLFREEFESSTDQCYLVHFQFDMTECDWTHTSPWMFQIVLQVGQERISLDFNHKIEVPSFEAPQTFLHGTVPVSFRAKQKLQISCINQTATPLLFKQGWVRLVNSF